MCVLRIMLAAHLAIWTPAWCCCMIKAAAGEMTGVATVGCVGGGCCSQRIAARRPAQRDSCCAKRARETCCEGDADGVTGGPIDQTPSSCSCHNELNDVVRLDTGSRVSVPVLTVDMHAGLVFVNHQSCGGVELHWRDSAVGLREHPPPATLLEQRCQLII
ncbi:MAG: hypothetical protein L0Y44_10150 [Phycisphaerales bacterium]|nr:hypothetical protein [Phycisphaerales bacterium]MCI0630998.1 hypothetical protein [Phycisphaerales bacterium]MCI0676489.1 hypothetical protein [Phycisphaerales bacterium]